MTIGGAQIKKLKNKKKKTNLKILKSYIIIASKLKVMQFVALAAGPQKLKMNMTIRC